MEGKRLRRSPFPESLEFGTNSRPDLGLTAQCGPLADVAGHARVTAVGTNLKPSFRLPGWALTPLRAVIENFSFNHQPWSY